MADALIERLWERMSDVFGTRWTSQFGDDAHGGAGQTWAKCLAGLAPQQIAAGFEAMFASATTWPPSATEFRAMCAGVPSLQSVRADLASAGAQRAPFTRLVWSKITDPYRYRTGDARESDALLSAAYDVAREHVLRGEPLPEVLPEIAVEPPRRSPATPETSSREIARCRELLGLDAEDSTC